MLQDVDTAVSVCYVVRLDTADLGVFTSCEGLGVEMVTESREEGGNNGMVWQLPTRLRYPNVRLSRPVGKDSEKVAALFAAMVHGYTVFTGTIQAMTADGRVVAQWNLLDAVPVRWTGPAFSPEQPRVLTETVEIAHHGFLVDGV